MFKPFKFALLSTTVIFACNAPLAALAQSEADDSSGDDTVRLSTVTVSAQKRDQDAKDVPFSLTALPAEAIEAYQITGLSDIVELAPNVGFTDGGSKFNGDIAIRGITDFGGSINAVATYVDEINVTPGRLNSAIDPSLLDVERIEVLRGPQGTLFGRNAVGGAINLVTRKPGTEFGGSLEGEYGSFDTYSLNGGVDLPVADGFSVRLSAFYNSSDGFISNIGPAGGSNDYEDSGYRLAARFNPTPNTIIDLSASVTDNSQGLNSQVPTGVQDDFFAALGFPVDPIGDYAVIGFAPDNSETVVYNAPQSSSRESTVFTGRLEHDFGPVIAVLTAGVIEVDSTFETDNDRTSLAAGVEVFDQTIDSTTFEARLQSDTNGSISWIGGVSYAKDETSSATFNTLESDIFPIIFPPLPFPPGFQVAFPDQAVITNSDAMIELESYGIFGDLTWTGFDGNFDLSVGLRYSSDEVTEAVEFGPIDNLDASAAIITFTGPTSAQISLPEILQPAQSGTESFDHVTARISGLYRINENVNVYGTISKGTRPGGFNLESINNAALPTSYDTEELLNYELGLKGLVLNGRLDYAASVFYQDYSDIQSDSIFFPAGTTAGSLITLNAGEAEVKGAELEFAAQLTEGLTINGGIGYLDAEFTEFLGVDVFGAPADFSGNTLPLASKWSGNLAAEYRVDIGTSTEGFLRAEYSFRSDFFQSEGNIDLPGFAIDGFDTLNLRAGVEHGNWRASVFGENLNEEFTVRGSRASRSALAGIPITFVPRRYGVTLSRSF